MARDWCTGDDTETGYIALSWSGGLYSDRTQPPHEFSGGIDHIIGQRAYARQRAAFSYQCRFCGNCIGFLDRKPFNPDGSPHRCLSDSSARQAPANKAIDDCTASDTSVIGSLRIGRHLTRGGKIVYISGRYPIKADRSKSEYPWVVRRGNGESTYTVDDFGRHMKNGSTEFDIVSRYEQNEDRTDVE